MGRASYDLIIFDCDGTLVDSEYLNNKVSAGLLNDFGLTQYTPENFMEEFAGNTWTDIRLLLEDRHQTKLPDDLIENYIEKVNTSLEKDLLPIEGAKEFVALCQQRTKICVGSNGQRSNVFKSLEIGGFKPAYFEDDTIFTRIQVPNGKPAPDLFLFAAERMGVTPDQCLVIEDSPTGVTAGVAAGMDVLGFIGTAHDKQAQEEKLKKAGVGAVFDRFIHIREHLGY